jgi:glycosyltransferase involved in cell wall biosynthesis
MHSRFMNPATEIGRSPYGGDVRSGLRFLLVSGVPPLPPTTGSRQRTHHLIEALRACGTVDLLLVTWPGCCSEEELQRLQRDYGLVDYVECCLPVSRIRSRLRRRFSIFEPTPKESYAPHAGAVSAVDRAVASGGYNAIIARYLLPTARTRLGRFSPVIVDLDDVDYGVWESMLSAPDVPVGRRLIAQFQRHQLRRIAESVIPTLDHVWLAKEEPEGAWRRDGVSVLPNIATAPVSPVPASDPSAKTLVIVASMVYWPNVHGVQRFVDRIWPRVREACPDAILQIVGRGLSEAQASQWAQRDGVSVEGFVEDLCSVYSRCALAVAPVYIGSGTKVKVLEALAHRRTCVVTPHALAGFGDVLRHEEAVWCGADDEEMADGCIRLLNDPTVRHGMELRGQPLVTEHYNISGFKHIVRETVDSLVRHDRNVWLRPAGEG